MGLQAMVARYCTVQDALVWHKRSNDASGKPVYDKNNPDAIKVRWDALFVDVIRADGRTVTSNAAILSPSPLPVGDWIFLGTLADWKAQATYPSLPTPLQGGYEIIKAGHNPDFQGQELLYTGYV